MTEDDKSLLKKVEITPKDFLGFDGKIDDVRKETVTITNPTTRDIAFKFKGTSPDVIKMRPGYGYLKPSAKIVITVILLPLRDRPRQPTKERLVILLALAPIEKPDKPADLWRHGQVPKHPLRHIVPIKIEGFGGYKGKPKAEGKEDKSAQSGKSETSKKKKKRRRHKITRSGDEDDEKYDRKKGKHKKKKPEKPRSEKSSKKDTSSTSIKK